MSWRKVKLGDLIMPVSETYHGSDDKVVLINTSDVFNGKITNNCLVDNINLAGQFKKTFRKNDILFSEIRPANKRFALVGEDDCSHYIASTKLMVLRKFSDEADLRYVYSVITSDETLLDLQHLAESRSGTFPQITFDTELRNRMIALPPLPIQRKIADVLGAYDDLIENNRKRIALLEKMARELYRERFVRRAVEGVETSALEKIAKFVRGKVIVKEATKPGNVPVVAGGLEPAYYHDAANTDAPVVTVSGSGANAGFARMYFEKVWASDCSWVDVTTTKYIRFVYCFLKDNDAQLRNAQKGAAQPHVHAKDVNALVVTAHIEQIAKFEDVVTPVFDEVANLTLQSRILARQRDRLLPRLMSGKIDVEKLVKEGK